jgi:hypothetical protein
MNRGRLLEGQLRLEAEGLVSNTFFHDSVDNSLTYEPQGCSPSSQSSPFERSIARSELFDDDDVDACRVGFVRIARVVLRLRGIGAVTRALRTIAEGCNCELLFACACWLCEKEKKNQSAGRS